MKGEGEKGKAVGTGQYAVRNTKYGLITLTS